MRNLFSLFFVVFLAFSCDSSDNNNQGDTSVENNSDQSEVSLTTDDTSGNGSSENEPDEGPTPFNPSDCDSRNSSLLSLSDKEKERLISVNRSDVSAEILKQVNDHRAGKGLKALKENNNLLLLAIQHNEYQIEQGKISHDLVEDRFCSLLSTSIPIAAFSENTASGQRSATEVVKALLESEGHRKNIEGDFDEIANSVVANKDGRLFYAQLFMRLR